MTTTVSLCGPSVLSPRTPRSDTCSCLPTCSSSFPYSRPRGREEWAAGRVHRQQYAQMSPSRQGCWQPARWPIMATAASAPPAPEASPVREFVTVSDAMTRLGLISVKPSTTVDEALEALVDNRITGMPVVDDHGRLVGVVSDYDLLALDSISGSREEPTDGSMELFPAANKSWKAFKEIQKLVAKTHGKTVGEVMTPNPLAVRPSTNLEDAARLLLESRYRRLPVVDESGKLIGIITRGNIVRAALETRRTTRGKGQ